MKNNNLSPQPTINEVYCDNCKHEFAVKTVGIKEADVQCRHERFTLVYFVCPKCHSIYRVCLKDQTYVALCSDLEQTKSRIRKFHGRNDIGFSSTLVNMVRTKAAKLERHVASLNRKYPGTFAFAVPEKGEGNIIYRE